MVVVLRAIRGPSLKSFKQDVEIMKIHYVGM